MATPRQSLENAAATFERRPAILFCLLTLFYGLLVVLTIGRGLWFDELFTYYIAKQPDFRATFEASRRVDMNPPLIYGLVRLSHALFGDSTVATRLPSVVGFWLGSAAFFAWLGKRTGYVVAAGAIAVFWAGFFLMYATEARPYGIWLGFFGGALLCWDRVHTPHRRLAIIGLFLCTAGMLMSHMLAPFSLGSIYLGELVRTVRRRFPDWPVWLALLLPLSVTAGYVAWTHGFQTMAFPPAGRAVFPPVYQASPMRILRFYARLGRDLREPAMVGLLAGLAVMPWRGRFRWTYRFSLADAAIGLGLFLVPYLLVAALMTTHSAFHWRYAIVGSLALWTGLSLGVNYLFRNSKLAGIAFVLGVLATPVVRYVLYHHHGHPTPGVHAELTQLKPELPFVAGSGLTFLELDHYELPELTGRLFYLTDQEYAVRYANATLWQGYRALKEYFPIRSNIADYREFIARNPHFLVLGTDYYLEDWLLKRLRDEKSLSMKRIATLPLPYKDVDVYEVQRQERD